MIPKSSHANITGNVLDAYMRYGQRRNALAPEETGHDDRTMAMIREFEGFRETPYWDVNAFRAGYGSDTVTLEDGTVVPVRRGMSVSREDAERDLARRIRTEFEPSVIGAIGSDRYAALSPDQRAALVSLPYNYGAGAWDDDLSGVGNALRSGGDVAAAINALAGHNNGINARRRAREASFF